MPSVGIIGAGLIGRSWANVFARAGWAVRVWDPAESQRAAAVEQVARSLADLAQHGLVQDVADAARNVRVFDTLAEAVQGVDFVQESGPETVDAKRATFAELDAAAPASAVLASSTSAIVASQFTADLAGRARCIVAHPVNPPHLVPVVELCGAPWTSPATKQRALEVFRSVGQVPIDVKREIDGFILNRLQVALLSEAFRLVQDDYVTPQDLDHVIADGLGLRWAFMGPFETIELNAPGGIPDYCQRYTPWFRRYSADQPPMSVWDEAQWRKAAEAWGRTPSGAEIAKKSAWRNERLAALVAHKRAQKRYTPE
ncbi:MAG: 3-hydroxyacyl-CoA dehydrogenase [Burkholderiales bacterium]|jgi:3-hydroxyacyl-CoA dehydrogenase|nr:3-hydroxyacyl-CoA dehydrogenase [Burkholderiales bacterium]